MTPAQWSFETSRCSQLTLRGLHSFLPVFTFLSSALAPGVCARVLSRFRNGFPLNFSSFAVQALTGNYSTRPGAARCGRAVSLPFHWRNRAGKENSWAVYNDATSKGRARIRVPKKGARYIKPRRFASRVRGNWFKWIMTGNNATKSRVSLL